MSAVIEESIKDDDIAHIIAGALFLFLQKNKEEKENQDADNIR